MVNLRMDTLADVKASLASFKGSSSKSRKEMASNMSALENRLSRRLDAMCADIGNLTVDLDKSNRLRKMCEKNVRRCKP